MSKRVNNSKGKKGATKLNAQYIREQKRMRFNKENK